MRRLIVVGVLVASSVLAACGGKDEPAGPTATVPSATTTTIDPYVVPEVIDEAYVNRVLAGLDQAVGDVTRQIIAERALSNEAADRVTALYLGDALVLKLQGYQSDVLREFAGYRENPGNKRTIVTELITGESACIFAKVERDASAVSLNPDSQLATQWVALAPLDGTKDPTRYNRVGWMYTFEGFLQDLSAPADPCTD